MEDPETTILNLNLIKVIFLFFYHPVPSIYGIFACIYHGNWMDGGTVNHPQATI